jgi:hypothetical protein
MSRGVVQVRKRARKLGLSRPLKRWSDEEDQFIRASHGHRSLADVAGALDRGISEISSRARKLGFPKWRVRSGKHAGRPVDGFANGKAIYTHRAVMERKLGRRLGSGDIVHHIDCDKGNNSEGNLHLFAGRAAHRRAHCSLEALAAALLERRVIEFDRNEGLYRLCEIRK